MPQDSTRPIDGRSLAAYTYGRGDPAAGDPDRVQAPAAPRLERRASSPPHGSACAPAATSTSSTTAPRSRPWSRGSGCRSAPGALTDSELYDLERDPYELAEPPRRHRLRRRRGPRSPRRWPGCARARGPTACSTSTRRRPRGSERRSARRPGSSLGRGAPIEGLMFDIDEALRYVVEHEGSDLHLKVPSPPMMRIHGELRPIAGAEPLDRRGHRGGPAPDRQRPGDPARSSTTVGEADFSYAIPGVSRFRVNAFRQRGTSRSPAARSRSRSGRSRTSGCRR